MKTSLLGLCWTLYNKRDQQGIIRWKTTWSLAGQCDNFGDQFSARPCADSWRSQNDQRPTATLWGPLRPRGSNTQTGRCNTLRWPSLTAWRHGARRCSTLSQPSKKAAWKTWPLSKNAPGAHRHSCHIGTIRHFRDVVLEPLPRTKEFEFLELQPRQVHF